MVQGQEAGLTIGALAAAGGVGVETIRYYQRIGLVRVPASTGGYRRYDGEDLRRLHFVRSAKAAGFTLAEARDLLDLDADQDRARAHAVAMARIRGLDARIAELQHARAALARLAAVCAASEDGPCPILTAFDGDR